MERSGEERRRAFRKGWSRGLPFAVLLILASCSGPSVQMLERPVTTTRGHQGLSSGSALAASTRRTLRRERLPRSDQAIDRLVRRYQAAPTAERRNALAELLADTATRISERDPRRALGYYLDSLRLLQDAAVAAGTAEAAGRASEEVLYSFSAAQVARLMHEREADVAEAEGEFGVYELGVASGPEFVDPGRFDAVVPAEWLQFRAVDLEPVRQDGFGAALIGHRRYTKERASNDPMLPPSGRSLPLNASVRFDGSRATLALQDLMVSGRATINGQSVPLEGDFASALALFYYDRKIDQRKILATLRPGNYEEVAGMQSVEPFRKDKIPLILVHGLLSSAESWLPFANLLRADPTLRERYQIFFFNYPSGKPIILSAAELRDALVQLRRVYNPDGTHPYMDDAVLLGHSMGGVLTNLQIRDSSDHLERLMLEKPIDELAVDEARKRQLRRLFVFDANPDVDEAIIIAAPLRGSEFAANPIGQLGAWLIRLPFDLVDSLFGELMVVDALTNVAQDVLQRPPNSVNSLRPDNPILTAALELPLRDGVEIHTIIAQKDPDDSKEAGTDGLVAYWSAHLEEAVSEKVVVGANHRSVVTDERAVEEVWRILAHHARAPPPSALQLQRSGRISIPRYQGAPPFPRIWPQIRN